MKDLYGPNGQDVEAFVQAMMSAKSGVWGKVAREGRKTPQERGQTPVSEDGFMVHATSALDLPTILAINAALKHIPTFFAASCAGPILIAVQALSLRRLLSRPDFEALYGAGDVILPPPTTPVDPSIPIVRFLMRCGHVATAIEMDDYRLHPLCTVCDQIIEDDLARKVWLPTPDIAGRKARCRHFDAGAAARGETTSIAICTSQTESSLGLALFEYRPSLAYDLYFCGCKTLGYRAEQTQEMT